MMSTMRTMMTCHWSARRIQRYLDSDPDARLNIAEVRRLETHLEVCEKCNAAAEELRGIKGALSRLSQRNAPDPALVVRVRLAAAQLIAEDVG